MKFERIYLDADTPLLRAALSVQESFFTVVHKESGRRWEFKNQTEFWGHWSKKDGGWLKDINARRKEMGKDPLLPDDFSTTEGVRLRDDIEDHVEEAVKQWDFWIGRVKSWGIAKTYSACIGGEGNFRYDLAQQVPYKGQRQPKPILFYDVREEVLAKYGGKMIVVDNVEVDDFLSQVGWENLKEFSRTRKWRNIIGYLDKDLHQIVGPKVYFGDEKPKPTITTPIEAARAFCSQMLTGDKTDNILGLKDLAPEFREKYGIRKGKGVGPKTADAILGPCETIKEMFERVVEAYKTFYGEEPKEMVSHRGEKLYWNYMDYLKENSGLLWLRRDINTPYDITDSLEKLGINPDEV